MLDRFCIRANDQQTEPRKMGQRRPHLLAVDDPFVTIANALRCQTGEVGPGAGFAEQLAPDLLAREQRPEIALLLRLAPPRDDSRPAHAVTDRIAVVRVG